MRIYSARAHKISLLPSVAAIGLLCGAIAIAQQAPATTADVAATRTEPPRLRVPREDGVAYPVAAGTMAPDGIGATVKSAVTAGEYNNDVLTYVPWEDASVVQPLPVGSAIPADSVVRSATGDPFSLNDAVQRQPAVLIFYRGGWCPYCNAHLRELQTTEPELAQLGYQILAVSTDTPEEIRDFMADNEFRYTLLSDDKLEVAARFGIRYKLVQAYLDHRSDIDFKARNGGYMLTPGVFIVDRQGVIRFVYVNNNYSVRVSHDALLQAARDALPE